MSARRKPWSLAVLVWVLLQACATPPGIVPSGGVATADRVLLCGKPGKPKGSATKAPREATDRARSVEPSYKLGESDGGPGLWEKAPLRPKGAGYQKEITGAPEGVEYAVPARTPSGKVLFDGYRDGKLLDAKDWEQWPPANEKFWRQGLLEDAENQLGATRGTPIEWHFPNEEKAQVVRKLLKEEGIGGIDVKVTRKK